MFPIYRKRERGRERERIWNVHAFALMQIIIGEREKSKGKDIMNTYTSIYEFIPYSECSTLSLSLPLPLSLSPFIFIYFAIGKDY